MKRALAQVNKRFMPFGWPRRPATPRSPDPRRAARWVQRRFHRYQPLAVLAVFAVLVGVPLFLDLFVSPVRDLIEGQAHDHAIAINLLEHLLVAALVASAAFYWVLGRRRQKALNSYRFRACDEPWELFSGRRPRRLSCGMPCQSS